MKKKLLWKGTLGELRKHYLYSVIKDDILTEVGEGIDEFKSYLNKMAGFPPEKIAHLKLKLDELKQKLGE